MAVAAIERRARQLFPATTAAREGIQRSFSPEARAEGDSELEPQTPLRARPAAHSIDRPWPSPSSPTVLHSVADKLARQVATVDLLKAMVDRVVSELEAERGTLYLIDALTGELCSRVARSPGDQEIRLPPGRASPVTWPRPASQCS